MRDGVSHFTEIAMASTTRTALGGVGSEHGGMYVLSVGQGPPVLVMHGGPGLDHTYLRPGLDRLASGRTLVYYDHRGNGRSPRPATSTEWRAVSHASLVADADALRARLRLERMIVFGHSYGGLLAQAYALAYPDRVAGLILCATYPTFDYIETALALAQARATPAQLAVLLGGMAAPSATDDAFGEGFRAVLPIYFHTPTPDRLAAFDDVQYSAAAFAHAFGACLPGYSTLDRLASVHAPTLVLAGAVDWIAPPALGAARLVAAIPRAELVLFEQSGHFPFLEQPELFTATVSAWLERVAPTRGRSGEERWGER
jgi:proline iminopeptidase